MSQNLLKSELPKEIKFHTYRHTKDVVYAVQKIAHASGLSNDTLELLIIAAWFHDTGFIRKYVGHEVESIQIASDFLRKTGYPERNIIIISELILATTMPQQPKNELEEILCDADLWHLSAYHYDSRMKCLRSELESIRGEKFLDKDWCTQNLAFFKTHRYKSKFGKDILEKRKQTNIHRMEKRAKNLGKEAF